MASSGDVHIFKYLRARCTCYIMHALRVCRFEHINVKRIRKFRRSENSDSFGLYHTRTMFRLICKRIEEISSHLSKSLLSKTSVIMGVISSSLFKRVISRKFRFRYGDVAFSRCVIIVSSAACVRD